MTVHLHVRSCYSLMQSTIRIPELVRMAKAYGYDAVALTDHNVMHGTAAFLDQCKKENIHGIVGLEADCRFYEDMTVPFLLLARDDTGYKNLMRLSTRICTAEKYCTREELIEACGHCVLIVYGEGGCFDRDLLVADPAERGQRVKERMQELKEILPEFEIGLSRQESAFWSEKNAMLKRIAVSMKIRTLALNKIYYPEANDSLIHKVLRAIAEDRKLRDGDFEEDTGRYFRTKAEMEQLYDVQDLKRTDEIAQSCRFTGTEVKTSLPKYPVPEGVTSERYLKQLCRVGLDKRLNGKITEKYIERLRYELSIIVRMHFEDYFLIVFDYVRFALRNGIRVGPGRGSAAGSLVSYCLGITQIDPLQYDLLFERFLNPDRVTMPDIDIDFPDDRRMEVIQYVADKYEKDHVAGIVTFQTFGARQALKDVAAVLGISQEDVSRIVRLIPVGNSVSLKECPERNKNLKQIIHADETLEKMYTLACAIQGIPKNVSTHPAGIVMSEKPLTDVVPLAAYSDGLWTTQFSKYYLEPIGLIKMDFLSLRFLTMIEKVTADVNKYDPDFNTNTISLDDPRIYPQFAQGDTSGIFQFDTEEMRRLIRRMKPQSFRDLTAATALNRPGAIQSVDLYLTNRAHPDTIEYLSEDLKPILKDTYGIMIYQEQVMRISQIAAGFSLARADILRKAMSKKDAIEMDKLRQLFIKGCLDHGYAADKAEELWNLVNKFGSYGFNKSHSVAYTVLTVQTAYLKAVYPLSFYTCFLNDVLGDSVKTSGLLDECRRKGIRIDYPDMNLSGAVYIHEERTITLPLCAASGIRVLDADAIVAERTEHGLYQSLEDCVIRLWAIGIDRRKICSLIDAGAFDKFGYSRSTCLKNLENILEAGELMATRTGKEIKITMSLSDLDPHLFTQYADEPVEKDRRERESLGFSLGEDPVAGMREKLGIDAPNLATIEECYGQRVHSFGRITNVREVVSKSGNRYARLRITDSSAGILVSVWPEDYRKNKENLKAGVFIDFEGKVNENGYIQIDKMKLVKGSEANGKNTDCRR